MHDNLYLLYVIRKKKLKKTSTDAVVMIIKHKVMVIFWEVSKYHEPAFISNPPQKYFILERTSYIRNT